MRVDGRGPDQMRPLKMTPDFISTAEGSVLIELGSTRVICTATVDDGVPGFLKGSGKGWVTSEYGMLPTSDGRKDSTRGDEGKTVRADAGDSAIDWAVAASRDGSGSAGRADGVDRLRRDSSGWRHEDGFDHRSICGAGAGVRTAGGGGDFEKFAADRFGGGDERGIVDDRALLDLAYEEDSRAEVDMNVVMTGSGHFVEIQATAEGRPFSGSEMQDLAGAGGSWDSAIDGRTTRGAAG